MNKDFSAVKASIDRATGQPAAGVQKEQRARRGRPVENVANSENGHHLTLYLDDDLYNYVDSMSRITRRSKARYITDLLSGDKEAQAALYAQVLEVQRKF